MNAEEFKEAYPKLSHLEGMDLIDAMEDVLLHQQAGEEIIKTTFQFWKRYQLRWLFYRKGQYGFTRPEWQTSEVCQQCKRGANSMMMLGREVFCISCGSPLVKVENKRIKYRLWLKWKIIDKWLEIALDKLHILRKRNESRYGIFGDESCYCYQTFKIDGSDFKNVHKPRRWFEYVFIKV